MGLLSWIWDWRNYINYIREAFEEMDKKILNENIDRAYYILSVCDMVDSIMEVD